MGEESLDEFLARGGIIKKLKTKKNIYKSDSRYKIRDVTDTKSPEASRRYGCYQAPNRPRGFTR